MVDHNDVVCITSVSQTSIRVDTTSALKRIPKIEELRLAPQRIRLIYMPIVTIMTGFFSPSPSRGEPNVPSKDCAGAGRGWPKNWQSLGWAVWQLHHTWFGNHRHQIDVPVFLLKDIFLFWTSTR